MTKKQRKDIKRLSKDERKELKYYKKRIRRCFKDLVKLMVSARRSGIDIDRDKEQHPDIYETSMLIARNVDMDLGYFNSILTDHQIEPINLEDLLPKKWRIVK